MQKKMNLLNKQNSINMYEWKLFGFELHNVNFPSSGWFDLCYSITFSAFWQSCNSPSVFVWLTCALLLRACIRQQQQRAEFIMELAFSRSLARWLASVMAKQWNVLLDLKVVDGPNKGEKTERKCRVTLAWDKTWSSIGFMAPVTRLCNDRRAGICSRKNNYSAELVSSSSSRTPAGQIFLWYIRK